MCDEEYGNLKQTCNSCKENECTDWNCKKGYYENEYGQCLSKKNYNQGCKEKFNKGGKFMQWNYMFTM